MNAIPLPAVSRINAPAAVERCAALAETISLTKHAELAEAVVSLNRDLDLPAIDAPHGSFSAVAERAVLDHSAATLPRPLTVGELLAVLEEAWA
ncbi:iron-containing alcohol dehydrogenase [Aurantimonas sp. HBX-1]|uniref:iron-containing alcohol dehydrogenase n=1 Tax=Aurantimonas sp. HBX-1 TaxID=2906072 RepID=UPI00351CF5B7